MKEAAIQVIYIQEPEGYEEGLEITHNSIATVLQGSQ